MWRPILARHITYLDVMECRVDINDIAAINEAMDVKFENETRAFEAAKNKPKE